MAAKKSHKTITKKVLPKVIGIDMAAPEGDKTVYQDAFDPEEGRIKASELQREAERKQRLMEEEANRLYMLKTEELAELLKKRLDNDLIIKALERDYGAVYRLVERLRGAQKFTYWVSIAALGIAVLDFIYTVNK